MQVYARWRDSDDKPDSAQVLRAAQSAWPAEPPSFADLQEDGTWWMDVPQGVEESIRTIGGSVQCSATIDGDDLILTVVE